jgi:hypothetical protein
LNSEKDAADTENKDAAGRVKGEFWTFGLRWKPIENPTSGRRRQNSKESE